MTPDPYDDLEGQSLLWLAQESANALNPNHDYLVAEITRRVAQAQIDSARYMRWSVVALGIAAAFTAIFQGLAWVWPNPLHLH